MSESVVDQTLCGHCAVPRHLHTLREQAGEIRHRWSADRSTLTAVEVSTPTTPSSHVVVAPSPDILLRRMLRDLGVITPEQYKQLFS